MNKGSNRSNEGESDFCVLNERPDARLSDVERLTLLGGSSLDRLLSTLAKSLAGVSLQELLPALDFDLLVAAAHRFAERRATGVVSGLLSATQVVCAGPACVTPVHGFRDGMVYDVEFPSPFPALSDAESVEYRSCTENQTAHARVWEHAARSAERLTVVAIHGWTMGDQRINSLAFLPGFFYSLGYDVALVELPFHGRRRPRGAGPGAPLFPSADPFRALLGVAHALRDVRALAQFLGRRGHAHLVGMGMSLGAYVAGLWLSLDRLRRGVLLVPLVSMGDIAWSLVKERARAGTPVPSRVTRSMLQSAFFDHSPLAFQPRTDPGQILVIGGRGDSVIPQSQLRLLQRHWPQASFEWVDGGHAATAGRGVPLARIVQFLGESDTACGAR